MTNRSLPPYIQQQFSHSSIEEDWTGPVLASCSTLKWIGIYLCFVFICGIILNSFVIYKIIKKKLVQSPITIFIMALAIADLAHALFGIPLPLTSNLACRWLYGKYLCYYEAFLAYFVGMIGLYLLTALSVTRYWLIVTPHNINCITLKTVYKSVFASILGGLFWAIAPVFGWSHYSLEGVRTSCSIHWRDRTLNVISYNIMMFIFAYAIPLLIVSYCNIKIYLQVHRVSQRTLSWSQDQHSFRTRHKENIDKHMAKTVFFIIRILFITFLLPNVKPHQNQTSILVTFIIAWTPYAIVAFISSFFSPTLITPMGGTLPAIFAKSSIYFNPLVYIGTNTHTHSRIFFFHKMKNLKSSDSTLSQDNHENEHLECYKLNTQF